jgi:hypothetical protein
MILIFMNFDVAFEVSLEEVILTQQVMLKNDCTHSTGNDTPSTFITLPLPVSNILYEVTALRNIIL